MAGRDTGEARFRGLRGGTARASSAALMKLGWPAVPGLVTGTVAILALARVPLASVDAALLAGAAVALAPLARRAFPAFDRLAPLAAAAIAVGVASPRELLPWAAAIVAQGAAASRLRTSGRLGPRGAAALALAVAMLVPFARDADVAIFVAIFAAGNFALVVRARGVFDASPLLDAAWPLFDAVALAACGHPVLAIECVAVVPLARRLALGAELSSSAEPRTTP